MNCLVLKKIKFYHVLIVEAVAFLLTFALSFLSKSLKIVPAFVLSIVLISCLVFSAKWFVDHFVKNEDKNLFAIISVVTAIIGLVIYTIIVFGRKYEYAMDYTVYYNQQLEMHTLFQKSSLKGCYAIISSFWFSDYSYFINVLLEAPYCIFHASRDVYVIIYYVIFIIPVIIANNVLLLNIYHKFSNQQNLLPFMILGNLAILFAPIIHFASWLGMPDIFGLYFVFGIMILIINFDFERFSLINTIALAILIICLTITRRWYVFWLVGFVPIVFVLYLVFTFIHNRESIKKLFIAEIKTALLAGAIVGTFLAPFLYHNAIARNYTEEYAEWYYGGFPWEINHQIFLLGWAFIALLFVGLVYGLINSKLRLITITSVVGFLISLFVFTRIQNMGYHHCLLLFSFYLILLYNNLVLIANCKKPFVRNIFISVFAIIIMINVVSIFGIIRFPENSVFTGYRFENYFQWVF